MIFSHHANFCYRSRAQRAKKSAKPGNSTISVNTALNHLQRRRWRFAMIFWSMAALGCATIRKLDPRQSHLAEARQLTRMAESAMHEQAWEEAEQKLVSAIQHCPDDDHARSCLSDVLWQRGANRAAIEQLKKSMELSGRSEPHHLVKLGNMELAEGLAKSALRHADEALAMDRACADAWKLKGHVKSRLNDPTGALDCFFRALSIEPRDTTARVQIANLCYQQGRLQRSLALLEGLSHERLDQHLAGETHLLKGLVLHDLGRLKEAVASLEMAHGFGKRTGDLYFHLADAQLALGDFESARSAARQALDEVHPADRPALLDLLKRIEVAMGWPANQARG
jgi:tetratricopeptide (TPR) repeat protein